MTIKEIQEQLKVGQVSPPQLAEMKDYLASISSEFLDRQLELHKEYADYFSINRSSHKSDNGCKLAFNRTDSGKLQLELDNTQRKIKVLREAISSHIRVYSDAARNMY